MAGPHPKGSLIEKLNTVRYSHIVIGCGQKVMSRVFRSCFLTNNTKKISEQLNDLLGNKYKTVFNKGAQEKIDRDDPPESLDITLLHKLCNTFWEKNISYPGDTLKGLLKEVKDQRNEVSHETLVFDQTQVETKLQDFKSTLDKILSEAAIHYKGDVAVFNQLGNDITLDISNVQDKIWEDLDPSNPDDCKKLEEELDKFNDKLWPDIQEKVRLELIVLYDRLCENPVFDWLHHYGTTKPSNMNVSLKLDTVEELHPSLNKKSIPVEQKELLTVTDPNGNMPDVVILSGDAGTGKTTLLSFILEKWAKNDSVEFQNLNSYKVLLRTEFRSDDKDNFEDYLQDLLSQVVTIYGFQRVKAAILQTHLLILCDGYDEHNEASLKLFRDLLELKSTTIKVVVTTRPAHTKDVTDLVNRSHRKKLNMSLLGMPEKSQMSLVSKALNFHVADKNQRTKTYEEIKRALLSMTPEIKALLTNPLYLNLFVLIWIECPDLRDSINTLTKIYDAIKIQMSKRLTEKLAVIHGIDGADGIIIFEKLYNRICFEKHIHQEHELLRDDVNILKNECQDSGLDFNTVMSAFFNSKLSRQSLNIVTIWCYKHRTEQEFGAAVAICDEIKDLFEKEGSSEFILHGKNIILFAMTKLNKRKDYERDEEIEKKEMQKVLTFITGIMYLKHRTLLDKCINDILTLVHLEDENVYTIIDPILVHLSESESSESVMNAVVTHLKNKEIKKWEMKDSRSFSYVPNLLSQMKPEKLFINVRDDPATLPHLPPAVTATETGVRLFLNLRSHFNGSVVGTSDAYISLSKELCSFVGSLTKTGIQSIPTGIEILKLRLAAKDIEELSIYLPTLTKLYFLCKLIILPVILINVGIIL